MKAVRGYSKEYYRDSERAPVILEFATVIAAARYLAEKYNGSVENMERFVLNDGNCDSVVFDDGSVILYEL